MSGLSRTFITEEERNTVMTLRLTAKPLSVFYGKLLFNTVLLTGLNIVTVSLFLIVIPNFTILNYGIFATTLVFATIGLSASSTILAAIISKANVKGTLYPVLSFPIMLPLLLSVINATKLSVENAPFMEAIGEFQVLLSYSVVILTVSYLLFEFIWND
jgi:heme exporter protein B